MTHNLTDKFLIDAIHRKVAELPPPPKGKHYVYGGACYGYDNLRKSCDITMTFYLKDDDDR